MTETGSDRSGHCARCTEIVAADGEAGAVMGGRLLCARCSRLPVVFEAECLDCDWSFRETETAAMRWAARQRVQQEGNSHESRASLNGADHDTVWRQLDPADVDDATLGEYVDDVLDDASS